MRVHFVPQGVPEDKDLIFSGILHSQAQKVFIIRNSECKLPNIEKRAAECAEQVCREIKKRGSMLWSVKEIDPNERKVNFFDLLQALGRFDRWIKNEIKAGNEVSVNISTGNKIVSLALAMAALKNGAKVFYYIPEDLKIEEYEKTRFLVNEEGYSSKMPHESIEITRFPFDFMRELPLDILSKLSELGGNVDSYTQLVRALYPDISSSKQIRSKRVEISEKVRLLESWGYVKTKKAGTERQVFLTPDGKEILHFVI